MKYINFNEQKFIEFLNEKKYQHIYKLSMLLQEFKSRSLYKYDISLDEIKELVERFGGQKLDVKSRERKYTYLRYVFFYLARQYTLFTFSEIGNFLNKNHGTVIHGVREFDEILEQYYFSEYKYIYMKCSDILDFRKQEFNYNKLKKVV